MKKLLTVIALVIVPAQLFGVIPRPTAVSETGESKLTQANQANTYATGKIALEVAFNRLESALATLKTSKGYVNENAIRMIQQDMDEVKERMKKNDEWYQSLPAV